MSENGTGMASPSNSEPSGAVTSREATAKSPSQGKFRSGMNNPKPKIDTNKHGIRRETSLSPKKVGRKKI
jgi:hypothetical protein